MRRVLRRLSLREAGYTVPEMVTVCLILGTVLGALTTLFVQATNAELDMNRRFHAQNEARLALDKLRHEVHCATSATPAGASASVTLTLPVGCKAVGTFTWCTVSVSTGRWALYREAGSTCDAVGSVKWADYLTLQNAFNYSAPAGELPKLHVEIPVDTDLSKAPGAWKLEDDLVLRNTVRP